MPLPKRKNPLPFERDDIADQSLGNVDILQKPELKPLAEPVVKYVIPPDLDVIGVIAPQYDCCVQKVIDEMGVYIKDSKMQFVVGRDDNPRELIEYFPKYILYFRSATVNGTDPGILAALEAHASAFRSLGMKLFYYLDDYLITMNERGPIRLMTHCDGVIASTNALKDYLLREGINIPIYVLKTHMALSTFNMLLPLKDIRPKDSFNILFSSQGRIGVRQFYRIVERMSQNPEKYKNVHLVSLSHEVAQIRSIINKFRGMRKTYLEWMPLDLYYRLCAAMDVIIAPGEVGDLDYMLAADMQQPWLDCKSAHKYTVAGASGIPCIASPLRDYVEAIKHGKTGFIAETDDQWMEYIDLMMDNPELRKEIGSEARKDVEANWNLYDRTAQLAKILRGEEKDFWTSHKGGEIVVQDIKKEGILEQAPPVMVYIPVHNQEEFIRECLDSVISQPYPNQEIVVSDNASTDKTREIVEKEYPQVRLIKFDTFDEIGNPGLDVAIKSSPCKFFVTLGGDDKLSPNFWETILPFFTEPEIGLVSIGCMVYSENNPEGIWRKPPVFYPHDILAYNSVLTTSPCRREAYDSTDGHDKNCFFGDWDMWIQVIMKGWKWAICKKPMFWYRRHDKAWSHFYDKETSGPQYSYMRDKWMWALLKYGVKTSAMATPEQIAEARKSSKYAKEDMDQKPMPSMASTIGAPKVLVYIPTYNSSPFIRECLDSVLAQKYPNQHIIVSDNASTDDTVSIIEKEYPMVELIKWPSHNKITNIGINEALKRSDCSFFMQLGSDDKMCENYWETLLPYFSSPEIGFVRIGAWQFGEHNPEGSWWKPFAWHNPREIFEANKVFISSPIRKAVWEDVGGFETNCVWGDWDFWMSAVNHGWKWNTYDKPMFWYRRREQQTTTEMSYQHDSPEFTYLRNKWLPVLRKLGVRVSMIATPEELKDGS